jgi:hypothetical protein
MHIGKLHIFLFEKPWQIYPKRSLGCCLVLATDARSRPRSRPRAIIIPDQNVLRELGVFPFPVILVNDDINVSGVVIDRGSVVCCHV